jgi:omega-amidase
VSLSANLTVGTIQFAIRRGDSAGNLDYVLGEIEQLGQGGVGLAVLPEMWASGFDYLRLMDHARESDRILTPLREAARKFRMVIVGSLPEFDGAAIFNTSHVIDADGRIAGRYRKIHLFSVGGENRFFQRGDRAAIVDTAIGRLGLMICYDLRFPELCRGLVLAGADLVVISAQWPQVRIQHWETLIQARAIENQLPVVACNCCGRDRDLVFGGRSMVVGPLGDVKAASGALPLTATADLDCAETAAFRGLIPCLRERVPEAYDVTSQN